ncbi:GGDEF domain-containing protein [Fibrobacter sp.]|uniref:GGDEF domain-containing protein n=1 Tax=Fibrobacter sp. TaxID=35828 RepID=UPI001B256E2B|nr:GGDEF domain-containing protein [Fibrobacter sp.]MBO7059582.1 GGDEF domain-containing protein [Fibrobacter sp.]MBO7106350.1 GGDEF domain-containing protein [Fibrobacter sp.]MBR3669879.1 GGDEF domain-containing protein [Fibrobacter sp.]
MSKIMEKIYALFRMNILIFVLLLVTVIALFAYRNGLDDIVFLNLADYPYIIAQTDSVDGGSSAIAMERTDSSIIVDYELREGYAYPYAGVKIFLGDGKTRGKDLSRYDSIFVWVKPRGEGTVRLYMRGYDSAFYRAEDETSLKFNEIEFFPLEETYPAVFVPQEFRVASWWVAQNEINVHKARVDLSNVPLIEIQTGTNAPLGYGTLEIKGLCFKGKKIAKLDLVSILVALWFVSFLIILIIRFFDYSRERAKEKKKREELEKNLRALEIEKSEYERSSKEDPLTGCLNRAGFSSVLMREQENLSKNGRPVSFVMLDIDHFKHINDTYGHQVGDEVLVNLTKLIQGKIRNTDALVRWGGEEFVVLCGDTPIQNAQFLAEKLRIAIENTVLIKQQQVTCSFGIAEMIPDEDPKRLFERADKALYASKEGGRNRVTSATYKRSR